MTTAPKRALHILFLDGELNLGGSEQLLLTLMCGLRDRGNITSLLYRVEGTLFDAFRRQEPQLYYKPLLAPLAMRHPRSVWKSLLALRRVAALAQADVIVASNPGFFSLLGTFRILGGCAVLVHLGWPLHQRSPFYRRSLRWLDAGIAPAPLVAREWEQLGWPQKRLHIVPNGINSARFRPNLDRPALRLRLGINPEVFLVVFVGRVVRDKGVFTLLRAWSLLQPIQAELRFFGPAEPAITAELHRSAEEWKLAAGSWCYAGMTQTPEDWLAATDLAVVPSENDEPFGLAAVEAMACNALTVVSDSGALPSLLPPGHSPNCIFPRGDFTVLADRLRYWINVSNEVVESEAQRAAMHASKHFGGDRMISAYERVLRGIVSPEKRAEPSLRSAV